MWNILNAMSKYVLNNSNFNNNSSKACQSTNHLKINNISSMLPNKSWLIVTNHITFFFFLFLFFNPWQSKQYCDTKKFFVCNFVYPVRNYLEKKWNCNVLQLLGCGTLFLFSLFGKRSFSDFHHLCCLWSGDPNREEDASDNLLPNCGTWNMRMIRKVNFVTE